MKTECFSRNKQRKFVREFLLDILNKSNKPINYLELFKLVRFKYTWITRKSVANILKSNCEGMFKKQADGWISSPLIFKQNESFDKLEVNFLSNFIKCPHCGSNKIYVLKLNSLSKCGNCESTSSPITGTIFGKSKIPIKKLNMAIALYNLESGKISTRRLSRMLKITQVSAWKLKNKMVNAKPVWCVKKDDLSNSQEVNEWNKSEIKLYSKLQNFQSFDKENKTTGKEIYETENYGFSGLCQSINNH